MGKAITQVLLHALAVGKQARKLLEIRLGMIFPAIQHVATRWPDAFFSDAEDQNPTPGIEEGVDALLDLLPISTCGRKGLISIDSVSKSVTRPC